MQGSVEGWFLSCIVNDEIPYEDKSGDIVTYRPPGMIRVKHLHESYKLYMRQLRHKYPLDVTAFARKFANLLEEWSIETHKVRRSEGFHYGLPSIRSIKESQAVADLIRDIESDYESERIPDNVVEMSKQNKFDEPQRKIEYQSGDY